jgi:hypothetical protein
MTVQNEFVKVINYFAAFGLCFCICNQRHVSGSIEVTYVFYLNVIL